MEICWLGKIWCSNRPDRWSSFACVCCIQIGDDCQYFGNCLSCQTRICKPQTFLTTVSWQPRGKHTFTYIYNIYIYTAVWKAVIQSIHHGDVPVPLTFRHGFCISQEWVTLKSIGFAANKGISRRPCDFDIFRLRLSEYYKVAEEQEDSQEALLALTKGQERVRRQCFLLQPTHSGKKLCETVDGSEMRRL